MLRLHRKQLLVAERNTVHMLLALAIILVFSVTKAEFNEPQTQERLTETQLLEAVSATQVKASANTALHGDMRSNGTNRIQTESVYAEVAQGITAMNKDRRISNEQDVEAARLHKRGNPSASGAAGVKSVGIGGARDSPTKHSANNRMFAYVRDQAGTRGKRNISRLIERGPDANRHKRQAPGTCDIGWTLKSGSCYKVTSELSWSDARQACISINSFLADIGSRREENDIYDFLNSQGIHRAWIGLNDRQSERRWLWDSGQAVTYVNWANGEPNDIDGSEDCVEILAQSRGGWNDNVCSKGFRGVCKKAVGLDSQCGYVFRDSGVIQSPGFPGTYQNNINCTFNLQAAPDHDTIFLQLRNFSTEDCCDHLRISDNFGLQLSFSGVRRPQNFTLGSRVTMSFTTDGSGTRSGFDMVFTSMKRSDVGTCGIGWTQKSGLCYKATAALTWSDATRACSSLNGFLTDIGSRSQENDIYDFLSSLGIDRAWIGLNDRQNEGRWLWESGLPVTYTNWGNGEPNDQSGKENCVEILAQYRNGWNDNVCNKSFHGVCQKLGNRCGGLFRDSGVIQSPGFPGTYPNNINCTYTIQAAPDHDAIFLQLRNFTTEDCCDHLRISDNFGLQLSFSGMRMQQNITLGSRVIMSFTTNFFETRSGFDFVFTSMKRRDVDTCGIGWTMKNGLCYKATAALTWSDAKQTCNSLNGFLTDVGSRSQENDIYDFLSSSGIDRAWLGLNDRQNEGQWLWDSGRAVTYTNWGNGEPNDISGNEDCVEILAQYRNGWNDNVCNKSFHGVCQKLGNQCGGSFSDSGVIQSPGFPGAYPSNINCTFTLQAAPEHDAIFLQIRSFSTEQCCDHLRISDESGQRLTFSGVQIPQNITLGSRVTLTFATDDSEARSGFDLVFRSIKPRDAGICGVGWTLKNDSCYKATSPLSWSDAKQACNSLSGFLTDIGSRSQENDIYELLISLGIDRAWIGLSDRHNEGQWQWESGRAVTYANWGNGEPNDSSGNEDCVEILAKYRNGWNDNVCNKSFHGVCQKLASNESCGEHVYAPSVISSPAGANCRWTVEASNASNSVLLEFESFSLDECCDHIYISDGSEFQYALSGDLQPIDLLLRSPVEIVLVSKKSHPRKEYRGFNITVTEVTGKAPRICRSGPWAMHGELCVAALWYLPHLSWIEARLACRLMGGFLVEPDDDDKLKSISEFLAFHASQTEEVWIGLKRNIGENLWQWDSGRPLTYSSWAIGQPHDDGRNASCASLAIQGVDSAWIGDDCNTTRAPMCTLMPRMGI